jgi:hypothetical protein
MRVVVNEKVQENLNEFYAIALRLHPALDEVTVMHKLDRLYASLEDLGKNPYLYTYAQYKKEWKEKRYRVYSKEGVLFAYTIALDESGETYVRVHDAVHSLLYHD